MAARWGGKGTDDAAGGSDDARPPWKRVLYEQQPYYPDNHVDPATWMRCLRNDPPPAKPLAHYAAAALPIVEQLTLVAALVTAFVRTRRRTLSSGALIALDAGAAAVIVAALWAARRRGSH